MSRGHGKLQRDLIAALAGEPPPCLTTRELAPIVGATEANVRRAMRRLLADGTVIVGQEWREFSRTVKPLARPQIAPCAPNGCRADPLLAEHFAFDPEKHQPPGVEYGYVWLDGVRERMEEHGVDVVTGRYVWTPTTWRAYRLPYSAEEIAGQADDEAGRARAALQARRDALAAQIAAVDAALAGEEPPEPTPGTIRIPDRLG